MFYYLEFERIHNLEETLDDMIFGIRINVKSCNTIKIVTNEKGLYMLKRECRDHVLYITKPNSLEIGTIYYKGYEVEVIDDFSDAFSVRGYNSYRYDQEKNNHAVLESIEEIYVKNDVRSLMDYNLMYDGSLKNRLPKLKKVIFREPATIAFWEDGTKTVVKCNKYDTFNEDAGIALCFMKKLYGKGYYKDIIKKVPVEIQF